MPELKLSMREIFILKAMKFIDDFQFALLKKMLKDRVSFGADCSVFAKIFRYRGTGKIEFGRGTIIDKGIHPVSFDLGADSTIKIGESCWMQSDVEPIRFSTKPGAKIEMGDRCWISGGLYGACERITIGNETLIAWDCDILDSNMHNIDNDTPYRTAPIAIGNNVWITHGVTILPGSVIGDNCVIGTGSLVSGEIPRNSLAVGRPARVIKKISDRDKLDIISRS